MEYFKKLDINEFIILPYTEKPDVAHRVIDALGNEVNKVIRSIGLSKKIEQFIQHLNASSLCELIQRISVDDIFNTNRAFTVEKILKRARDVKEDFSAEQIKIIRDFAATLQKMILLKPEKAFKSKGTNYVIRELLKIREGVDPLIQQIESMEIEYFIYNTTGINTYTEYIDVIRKKKKAEIVTQIMKIANIEMLKGYQSFLIEKIWVLAKKEERDEMFEKIKQHLLDLAKDPVGNYFVQTLIQHYDPVPIFNALKGSFSELKSNSNVLFYLCIEACKKKKIEIVEYMISSVFLRESLIKRLLFNEKGGFDSKTHKLAELLLSVKTKYLPELQMECISLYEKYWLFNKIGQRILTALLGKLLDKHIAAVLIGSMSKDFLGLLKAKGGVELLKVIEQAADEKTRRQIQYIRRKEQLSSIK